MPNLNKVFLMGHLTRDVDLRYTAGGVPISKFGLATNHKYKKDEEWVEDVCFVDITAFGNIAERCNEKIKKGSAVFIEGRLQYSSWETDDGGKRSKIEVVAEKMQFLDKKETADGDVPF